MGYNLGIIGCGVMGSAVLDATLENMKKADVDQSLVPAQIIVSVGSEKSVKKLTEKYKDSVSVVLGTVENNNCLVKKSDIVLLGFKPGAVDDVLGQMNDTDFKTVISLMAGVTIENIDFHTRASTIARALTNTPSRIGEGMTVISIGGREKQVPQQTLDRIKWMFENTGRCLFLGEQYQDVATALCGSGPAFTFLFMEALIEGAVQKGMPYAYAQECAAQVLIGAGKLVQQSGMHPGQLKSQVTSPGGTTIAGLLKMEDKGVRSGVSRAVEEAANVAYNLGHQKKK